MSPNSGEPSGRNSPPLDNQGSGTIVAEHECADLRCRATAAIWDRAARDPQCDGQPELSRPARAAKARYVAIDLLDSGGDVFTAIALLDLADVLDLAERIER